MPTVPVYEQQIQARPLPGVQEQSVATPALLGGASDSIAAASKGMTDAGIGGAAVAYHMQERDNADKVFQTETKWKADYLAYQADIAQNRKGDFAKGLTQDTQKWWDDSAKAHLKTLDNDVQRQLLLKRMSPVRLNSFESVSKYEATQREASLDQSATASKVGSIDLAAANADEATVQNSIADIKKTNAFLAARKGITDPDVLAKINEEDITKLHKQVLQTLVKKNPDVAKAYYDLHESEIQGSQRAELGDFAQKATAEALGVAAAGDIWNTLGPKTDKDPVNLDSMEQKARDQFKNDTYTLKATIANIRERFAAFNTGRNERENGLESAVNQAILSGASAASVRQMPEFLQLNPEKARSIDTFIENRAYTRAARADAEESRAQRRLSRQGNEAYLKYSDPDALVSMTRDQVINLLPALGPEHTANLVQRYDSLTKSAEALAAARIDHTTFKALAIGAGLHPDAKLGEEDKDRLVQLESAVNARLLLANRAAGKPLSVDERNAIAKQAFDDTVRLPGFFSAWGYGSGTDLPVSALTAAERDKAIVVLPEGRVRVKDIPPAFVDQAENTLKKAGRIINQKAVAQMWMLNKGTWQRGASGAVK